MSGNLVYFCSDFHFGINAKESSRDREKLVLTWLDSITTDLKELYVVGDLFDFWFEYHRVVPKGGIRILAALAQLQDHGIPVHLFSGNHDQWIKSYFTEELGIEVYHDPIQKNIQEKAVLIGHGDGLGPGDHGYKFIKKIFRSPIARNLFSGVPPGIGIPLAKYWSGASRAKAKHQNKFLGADKEWLIQYCEEQVNVMQPAPNYFIFGHRHLPIDWKLNNGSRYINLGDWLYHQTYAVMKDGELQLAFYGDQPNSTKIYSNHLE